MNQRYAHCITRRPVKHRRQVPFQPSIEVRPTFVEAAVDIRRLDAELDRFVLTGADYLELVVEATATNIHYSTELEGNPLTLKEVRRITRESLRGTGRRAKSPGHQEILNHLAAWVGPDVMATPWTLNDLLALHRFLFTDVEPDARPGELRATEAAIEEAGEEAFIPAPPQHIEQELRSLLEWVNRYAAAYFPIVSATVFFHAFESIHPFANGNGRTGRTLFHLYLQQQGLRNAHLCLVEPKLLGDRETYYSLLGWADSTGTYGELIEYFSEGLRAAYQEAVDRFQQKDLLSSGLDETAKRLLVMAKRHRGAFSVADAARWVDGRGDQTIRRHLNDLVELGALEAEGQTKARRYRFADPFADVSFVTEGRPSSPPKVGRD